MRVLNTSMFVDFPNRFNMFLQTANYMRGSDSKPNQVWKWNLWSIWQEAHSRSIYFASPFFN
jgi:hypothetical protein